MGEFVFACFSLPFPDGLFFSLEKCFVLKVRYIFGVLKLADAYFTTEKSQRKKVRNYVFYFRLSCITFNVSSVKT